MKLNNKLLFIIISICWLSSCREEAENDSVSTLSSVITLDAKVLKEGGVTLFGELIINGPVSEHGFIYSSDSLFGDFNDEIISLGSPSETGLFQTTITTSLENDAIYHYKTFIETEERLIYGETKHFESKGSKRPIITHISPEQGHLEDTVRIYGMNFESSSQTTSVYFFQQRSRIVEITDTMITCIVPETITAHQFSVTVTSEGKSAGTPFSLYTPVIDSFEPVLATFRDTIKIYGQHFDHSNARNTLRLGDVEAEIVFSARNRLQFVVPDDLVEGSPILHLTSQVQSVTSPDQFKLIPPVIAAVSECSHTNHEVTLEGNYLHPIYYKNKVLMEGVEAEVVSGSTQQLIVRVPYGPFPRGKALVEVGIADTTVNTGLEFCIQDPWLMVSNTLPFSFYGDVGTFTLADRSYVIANSRDINDKNQYLWEFDPVSISWTKRLLPFEVGHSGICVGNGTKGYVYTATATNNFWEYNPGNDEWIQQPDFPGARRDNAASFSVDGNLYIGIGTDYEPYIEINYFDFYKFDPSLNQWMKVSDFSNNAYSRGRTEASTFVIDRVAYVVGGARSTGSYDAWKYLPDEDHWIGIADFPDARSYTSSFSLRGKGYIANGNPVGGGGRRDCWEYDPIADEWNPFFDIGHKSRFRGFTFVVNDTAYVGGGSGGIDDSTLYELYKLTK